MVPKFCFPFDIERYGRDREVGIPRLLGPKDSQGLRRTLTTKELQAQGPRNPRTDGLRKPGVPSEGTQCQCECVLMEGPACGGQR